MSSPTMMPPGFVRPAAALLALCVAFLSSVSAQSPATSAPSTSEGGDTPAPLASTSSMEVLDEKRPLEHGDVLAFRIVEDRSGLFSLIVTDSGEVEIPYIGRVYAKGKTCKALAYEVKAELEKKHYQQATVIIGLDWLGTRQQGRSAGPQSIYSGPRVNVWGAVNREGPIALPTGADLSVADAILAAGGFTPFAKRSKVKVVRPVVPENPVAEPGEEGLSTASSAFASFPRKAQTREFTINVKDIMEKGRIQLDMILEPNDVIIVEEKLFNF